MSEPSRVELTLLGQTLTVRTDATPEYLRTLASYLEARVTDVQRSGVRDASKALALAALDITDELFREREGKSRREDDVRARLTALLTLLEQATGPGPRAP